MPGRRFTLYLLLILAVALGLFSGEPLLFTLVYFLLGTLILSLLWAWTGLLGLRLERQPISQRGQVGRAMDETFSVRNLSILPRLWLEIHDGSTLPGHAAGRVLLGVAPRGHRTWQVSTHCTRRGAYRLGPATLVSGDPFGFFERRRRLTESSEILIYPATVPLHGFAPAAGHLPGGEAVRERTHVITPNAAGIRDYMPGDSLRQIHWLSSARRGRLTVKEFEMDPMADFWIVLDNHAAVHFPPRPPQRDRAPQPLLTPGAVLSGRAAPPAHNAQGNDHPIESTEEYCVTLAASLAEHFLAKQRSVGLVTYAPDRAWIAAERGPRQQRKILELLAVTQATGAMALGDMLRLEGERFARTTTALVVTPAVEGAWLGAVRWLKYRRVSVVVILVDSGSFGGPVGFTQTTKVLYTEGIPVYPVRRGDNLSLALARRPVNNHNGR